MIMERRKSGSGTLKLEIGVLAGWFAAVSLTSTYAYTLKGMHACMHARARKGTHHDPEYATGTAITATCVTRIYIYIHNMNTLFESASKFKNPTMGKVPSNLKLTPDPDVYTYTYVITTLSSSSTVLYLQPCI